MHNKKLLKPGALAAIVLSLSLIALDSFVLLKTFVISEITTYVSSDGTSTVYANSKLSTSDNATGKNTSAKESSTQEKNPENNDSVESSNEQADISETSAQNAVTTATSYSDGNISVNISTVRKNDTDVYIAEVTLSDAKYLKTALAQNAFGINVTETTSSMAERNGAVLAINGDYYGADRSGYVIKNGVIYRNTVKEDYDYPDLAIYADGSFKIIYENEVTAEELLADGVVNLLSFGPSLVENGQISISENTEVRRAMSNNPRTAIGIIDELHYVFVVSDGRTSQSEGLSLYELAEIMKEYGCETAYNLDGGGSSTMYFNGSVINNPTTSGRHISEREVSDIVYIGY